MMRLFFHLHECGTVTSDLEGRDVPDLESARLMAVEAARAVMCAELSRGRLCLGCHIEIVDAAGARSLVVRFSDAVTVSGL